MALTGQIKKHWVATFIDSAYGATPSYVRLGKDLEELTVEMNPNVVTKKNIWGETRTFVGSYEKSASVEPYIAVVGEPLFVRLQKIVDDEQTHDDLNTTVVEVHLWEEDATKAGSFTAYKEDAIIAVSSRGVGEDGYSIPFELHYTGNRTKGLFDMDTKAFTPTP